MGVDGWMSGWKRAARIPAGRAAGKEGGKERLTPESAAQRTSEPVALVLCSERLEVGERLEAGSRRGVTC